MPDTWLERMTMAPLALAAGEKDLIPVPLAPLPGRGSYRIDIFVPELGWFSEVDGPVVVE